MSNYTDISKFIALVLRHKPEVIGITLDPHGWTDAKELVDKIRENKCKTFTMSDLEEIVATDNKQRYSFNDDKTKIRANQGHSVQVDVELEKATPPDALYHGTGEKYVSSIDASGLIPKSRLYVHLSKDIDTALNVGTRHGNPVIYKIDAKRMIDDGFTFYVSKNGVWLTEKVPPEYMTKELIG